MAVWFLTFLIVGGWSGETDGCIIAQTESGLVCGAQNIDAKGRPFVSFLGIPYAKPPTGELRFAEPQRPDPFVGIFDAMTTGPSCPQWKTVFTNYSFPQSEDCLRLNIGVPSSMVPNLSTNSSRPLLPVFVFVHGGSFIAGNGDPQRYGPEYLVSKDIIFIAIQYRLASLGFLSLDSEYIPGNAGLKDVFFGLQWIQRNIRHFGGDPEQVTLGGQSAGAGLAHLIALSPASKGLFKRLVIMSFSAIQQLHDITPLHAKHIANLFLSAMGINPLLPPKRVYQEIISAPLQKILDADAFVRKRMPILGFMPVIEPQRAGLTSILQDSAEELIKRGNDKEYPMLIGTTSNECVMYKKMAKVFLGPFRKLPVLAIPPRLHKSNRVAAPALTKMVLREYFDGRSIESQDDIVDYCTDLFWKYPVMQIIDARLAVRAEPTYGYEFGYEYKDNIIQKLLGFEWSGAAHSDDLPFLFRPNIERNATEPDELSKNDTNSRMADFMTTSFANFVKYGRPSIELSDWPPSGCDYIQMAVIGPDSRAHPAPRQTMRMKKFFDLLFDTAHSVDFHTEKSRVCAG